jgi:hypothetical protein
MRRITILLADDRRGFALASSVEPSQQWHSHIDQHEIRLQIRSRSYQRTPIFDAADHFVFRLQNFRRPANKASGLGRLKTLDCG